MLVTRVSMISKYESTTEERYCRMLKKAVSAAAASEEGGVPLRYVEPLSDARTKLAEFFSILPGISVSNRAKESA
jgi:hypothetical protein